MAIPSKKGLAAQFHWFKGSTLVNINGGHSEGYIRNASLGSVPKIANLSIFLSLILIHLDNHIFQGSSHHSLQVGMFYIIDCFSGLGVNIGSFIVSWPENQGIFFFFLYFSNIANEPDIFHGFPP